MKVKVLMITYNRPRYTQLSIEKLCASATTNTKITIWDNNSESETKNIIESYENHPKIEKVVYNRTNDKLFKPTNWFWENSQDAELIGKVDDDCLVPENWISILEKAHKDIPEAGALACWHFLQEDFKYEKAKRKIVKYNGHQIMRNCWVPGSGYLMKRSVIKELGILRQKESFTDYCIRAAAKKYINGWYYPLVLQENLDDPRTPNTGIKTEEDFLRLIPLSARTFKIKNREQLIERCKISSQMLQEYSYDPKDYIGPIAFIKRKVLRLFGRDYFPTVR